MRKRAATTLALATLLALVLTGFAATSRAQDAQRVVDLSPGCNMVTLTFATGTQASTLTSAVSPSPALQTIWRLDNASHSFQAFMPQAPQASDLTSLNLLDAAFICVNAAATIAMPALSTDPSATPISANLSAGCNAIGLTFEEGAAPSTAAGAITPADAFQALWRLDNATGSFQAYVAAAPQASDLTSLAFLDAVFVCTSGPATLAMPAVTAPAGGVAGGPPRDIRYVMEGAVPQVVDLPEGFVAVDENFESLEPPAALYLYGIAYGDPLAVLLGPLESPFFVTFQLGLFDTVAHAQSIMEETTSATAQEMQADLAPVLGGWAGLELESLTIEEVEPLATIGEEANFIRVRMYVRPLGGNEMILPVVMDIFTVRRDRVVGEVSLTWVPGPPGRKVVTENLTKKMDAGIHEALPELLAAVP